MSEAKKARLQAARRQRRIIFVDDNYGLSHQGSGTPEGFLKPRLEPLIGTQVDTITYAVYAHNPAYISKIRPRVYAAAGGTSETDKMWNRNHQDLVKSGHDPLQLVIDFAHGNGMEAFAHMSMNDCHDSFMRNLMHPFKKEHPELLVDTKDTLPNLKLYVTAYDFSHQEVQDRQFEIVQEVCERYDIDGFEMDFIRHAMFFSRCMRGEAATNEEVAIMTGFMTRIRKCADDFATRRGKALLLSARVPDNFELGMKIGLDVQSWMARDLVDIVIAGGGYASNTLSVKDFVEVGHEHNVLIYPCINQKPWSCDPSWRQQGNRALASTWHQADADGIHFWNLPTPFDPYNVSSQDELIKTRRKVYACLNEVGDAKTLIGNDKLYCVDSSVFIHYKHISSTPPLPMHLIPGRAQQLPLLLGDDVQLAARKGLIEELRLELKIHGPLEEGGVALKVNDQHISGGELLPSEFTHSGEHQHDIDGRSIPHAHYHYRAYQLTYLLSVSAPPLHQGSNELDLIVKSDPENQTGPLQLVNTQLWVKYKVSIQA